MTLHKPVGLVEKPSFQQTSLACAREAGAILGRPRKNQFEWLDTAAGAALREQAVAECDAYQAQHAFISSDLWVRDCERLLDEKELAVRLVLSPSVLARWRRRKTGPCYFKIGTADGSPVRYRWCDVLEWLQQHCLVVPGSDAQHMN